MTYRGYQRRAPCATVSAIAAWCCARRDSGQTCSAAMEKKMRIKQEKRIRMGKMQSSSPPDSHNGLSFVFVCFHTYIKEKRGNLYLSLVPHFEAFALPIIVKRATQKPTPICICLGMPSRPGRHTKGLYTHPADIYHCFVLTMTQKLRSFEVSKTKRQVNVSLTYVFPLTRPFPLPMQARDTGVRDGAKV